MPLGTWNVLAPAAEWLVRLCTSANHDTEFHVASCEQALPALKRAEFAAKTATSFDAGREALTHTDGQPQHTWTTSALMRVARDSILTPPSDRGLYRATRITVCLGRLAERGFPADAFVRTCMKRAIIHHLSVSAAATWLATRNGLTGYTFKHDIDDWLEFLNNSPRLTKLKNPALVDALAATREGLTEHAERWLEKAAIAHVIGWRRKGALLVHPDPDDLYLAGNPAATTWVFERFTETHLTHWSDRSLHWETAFNTRPDDVAHSVGLDRALLTERIVLPEKLSQEFTRRTINPSDGADDETTRYAVQVVLSLLEKGELRQAMDFSKELAKFKPQDSRLEQLRWFSSLPEDPTSARDAFLKLCGKINDLTLKANIATTYLAEGDIAKAKSIVADLRDEDSEQSSPVWLWQPDSLAQEPRIQCTSLHSWISEVLEHATSP